MPQGLQTFDQYGNVLLDLTDRVTRYIGTYFLAAGSGEGSIYSEGLLTGTPFPVFTRMNISGQNAISTLMQAPTYWYGGGNLYWSNPVGDTRLTLFVY